MRYNTSDLLLLSGKAGGQCSFPGCTKEIFISDPDDVIGHVAHIVARSKNGPRADDSFPPEKLHKYDNLILLCQHHHGLIDAQPEKYPVHKLKEMKENHENMIKIKMDTGAPFECNVSQFYYLNIPRLSALAAMNGWDIKAHEFIGNRSLHSLGSQLNSLVIQLEKVISHLNLKSVSEDELIDVSNELVGLNVRFSGNWRTKNVPGLDQIGSKRYVISGDINRIPQIYKTISGYKCLLTLDPRWITFTTAFVNFRPPGGIGTFAGLFVVKNVDTDRKLIVGSPLFIGLPPNPLDEFWKKSPKDIPRVIPA